MTVNRKQRILSGNRPTGRLHWGNYFGALRNWADLQDRYECLYFIADWHALTTGYQHPQSIAPAVREVLLDWLAVGLDPKKSVLFLQSWVPEHAELHVLLSMMTPLGWLTRIPSYKDMQQQLTDRDLNMYGFLGYPLLQAADIVIYRAQFVPVGEDQLSHIEFCRELVRRFHHLFGREDVLVEPQPLLTATPRVPGTDGRKMSKSFHNAIDIADDDKTIAQKMMQTITDPARKRREDPGNPEVCNIFAYHKLYGDAATVADVDHQCRTAQRGCVECKKICIVNAQAFWEPIRERRREWEQRGPELKQVLCEGSERARAIAQETMHHVRETMGMACERAFTQKG